MALKPSVPKIALKPFKISSNGFKSMYVALKPFETVLKFFKTSAWDWWQANRKNFYICFQHWPQTHHQNRNDSQSIKTLCNHFPKDLRALGRAPIWVSTPKSFSFQYAWESYLPNDLQFFHLWIWFWFSINEWTWYSWRAFPRLARTRARAPNWVRVPVEFFFKKLVTNAQWILDE